MRSSRTSTSSPLDKLSETGKVFAFPTRTGDIVKMPSELSVQLKYAYLSELMAFVVVSHMILSLIKEGERELPT